MEEYCLPPNPFRTPPTQRNHSMWTSAFAVPTQGAGILTGLAQNCLCSLLESCLASSLESS